MKILLVTGWLGILFLAQIIIEVSSTHILGVGYFYPYLIEQILALWHELRGTARHRQQAA